MKLFVIYTSRIGHLAMNTELFLRRVSAGMLTGALVRLTDHASGSFVANQQLYEMIRRKHSVFEMTQDTYLKLLKEGHEEGGVLHSRSNEFSEFNTIPPQLEFLPEEHVRGEKILEELGIYGKEYVCMHNRTSDYLAEAFPSVNFRYHDYRDCSIENYIMAAEWLTSQGIYVVRMGQVASDPMVTENPMIIDYTNTRRTDFGDIYLPAHCKFFLGNTAGIWLIATIFGRNNATANNIPFDMTPLLHGDIYINKNIDIPFSQQLDLNINAFESKNIPVSENSPEQILCLAMEMTYRLEKVYAEKPHVSGLRSKFRALWTPNTRCFGTVAEIGDQFIVEKQGLL
jgi:putative glycosyltransferase (TIGR04372 family)